MNDEKWSAKIKREVAAVARDRQAALALTREAATPDNEELKAVRLYFYCCLFWCWCLSLSLLILVLVLVLVLVLAL